MTSTALNKSATRCDQPFDNATEIKNSASFTTAIANLFFHYIYSKCGKRCSTITLSRNDVPIPDRESAEAFQQEFANNFNVVCGQKSTSHSSSIKCVTALSDLTLFNSNEHLVSHAISQCSNSNSSPDGISFKLIKMIARIIIKPLNIIFQHAFNEGIFPAAWKYAIVLPLFKGRGERCDPSSYRPISLCPCLGKILEKVVHAQLTIYLNHNNLLCQFQHGFTAGRSTTTNMLHLDNAITIRLTMHSISLQSTLRRLSTKRRMIVFFELWRRWGYAARL